MKSRSRNFLATGVSALAIGAAGVAAPVWADGPGQQQATSAATVDEELIITAVGDTSDTGVTESGSATENATIIDFNEGAFEQYGTGTTGAVELDLLNSGTALIHANATAVNAAGAATATASISQFGVLQIGDAAVAGDSTITMTNDGTLTITAIADASATSTALANAFVDDGVVQVSLANTGGDGNATATLANTSPETLEVIADADATGGAFAGAYATVGTGVSQIALAGAGDAAVAVDNSGGIDVSAFADATATTGFGDAHATVGTGVNQVALTLDGGAASADVANSDSLNVGATANAIGGTFAHASASVGTGVDQVVLAISTGANPSGDATASLSNTSTGAITVGSNATAAAATGFADADAAVGVGVDQFALAAEGNALSTATNEGEVTVAGAATATGATGADADVFVGGGINQSAIAFTTGATPTDSGNADVALANSSDGVISVTGDAVANGGSGSASASAFIGSGIGQFALSEDGDASADVTNDGAISVAGSASATVPVTGVDANAEVTLGPVVNQEVEADNGVATASLTNTGSIDSDASASAVAGFAGGNTAGAAATAAPAVLQQASGATAVADVANSGAINVNSSATAESDNTAVAGGTSAGIVQLANGADASAAISNGADGELNVTSTSLATADNSALATGIAVGAVQVATGTTASASFENAGAVNVSAAASADAVLTGNAFAAAGGVGQVVFGSDVAVAFDNSGTFAVNASANAAGAAGGTASALAGGYGALGDTLPVTVSNSGAMTVSANATGELGANAFAAGMGFIATGTGDGLSGTIDNAGTMAVAAVASGPSSAASSANALGVYMLSGENTATLTNSGTIDVSAQTANGGAASATAILVDDTGIGAPAAGEVLTLNNAGGSIIARESVDGGTTWTWGTAIDTIDAPNPVLINLMGDGDTAGQIYGNIELSADDVINVSDGVTNFDGIVNTSMVLTGQLNILDGGTLYLEHDPLSANGPSKVYVDDFNVAAGGTLGLGLPAFSDNAAHLPDIYPQVFANTADITDGTLLLRPSSANGLYADDYFFDNVIDANTLTGTFAEVGTESGTPLLEVEAIYDGADNVDLGITRVGFGDVAGLTLNQTNTGNGIENVYAPTLTGPFADVLSDLFLVNAADYPDALDQLSGDQYAGYLQGLRDYSMTLNTLVSDQIDCAISIDGPQKCQDRSGETRVWMLGSYNDLEVDTDINAPGYDMTNWSVLVGVDHTFSNYITVGAFGGYRDHEMDFDRNNGQVDADGWQLGLLAAYDVGKYYIRAIGSYADLNADSSRDISFISTPGTAVGSPDATVWSFYGEAGGRFNVTSGSWVTPFVGLDYTNVKLKSFTESGVPGANLSYNSQSEDQATLLAGLKWAGNFGGIVPEAKVAWRYELSSSPFGVNAFFDDAPAGSDFRVYAPDRGRSSVVGGLSLAAMLGEQFTGRVGYLGRFNSDVTDHAVYGSLTYRFGGAPAPAPAAPPPPPPAPAPEPAAPEVVCNTGPYVVFFDWDQSDITPEAATVLDSAITAYGNCDNVPIMLAGHTDRSGSQQYNMGLAERRNTSVRAYLTARGVADAAITSQAFGESNPRVPTADGVRELQNRRVEITYGPGSGM